MSSEHVVITIEEDLISAEEEDFSLLSTILNFFKRELDAIKESFQNAPRESINQIDFELDCAEGFLFA
ncbi:hypothetical protein DMENIID0001_110960 [Sergentomyia squamirostris]